MSAQGQASTAWYLKHYECVTCTESDGSPFTWTDEWDCLCNDRCPRCNVEHEPFDYEELDRVRH